MNSVAISVVIIPGFISVLLFLVFTYLHEQSRKAYFRAWQLAWAAYSMHYAFDAFSFYHAPNPWIFFASSLCLVAMALCVFVSTWLISYPYRLIWYFAAVGGCGVVMVYLAFCGR